MFGLNLYVIMAIIGGVLFCGGFINGCSYQQSKAEKVVREKEHEYQAAADTIRKDKDAKINDINNQLVATISSLRNASRTDKTVDGQAPKTCDGSQLFREDGAFLAREAARADEIRVGLESCYKQYDSLK